MEKTVSTKLTKDGTAVETKVTIDWSNVSLEELQKLASATVIINEQAVWRTSGTIPTSATIEVRKQIDTPRGSGFKPTPENMAARINKLPEADYRAALANLDGLTEAMIEKMVKAKYGK